MSHAADCVREVQSPKCNAGIPERRGDVGCASRNVIRTRYVIGNIPLDRLPESDGQFGLDKRMILRATRATDDRAIEVLACDRDTRRAPTVGAEDRAASQVGNVEGS